MDNCEKATAIGVDQSDDTLKTALVNAQELGLANRFSILKSNWVENVKGKFNIILSNPPYIAKKELSQLPIEVLKHDPLYALDGGESGLDAYHILARDIPMILAPEGIVGVEIGWKQARAVNSIFEKRGFRNILKRRDLSGNDRVLLFKYQ